MTNTNWKSRMLVAGAVALGLGTISASAHADDHAGDDEPSILKPCNEANVSLHDLAIGGDGKGVKTYYQGNVLMVQIDQVEPAAASLGIVILAMMPDSEMGERICMAATNFTFLDLDKAKSFYDRGNGLTVSIPAMDYNVETGGSAPGKPLIVKINLGKGDIDASR